MPNDIVRPKLQWLWPRLTPEGRYAARAFYISERAIGSSVWDARRRTVLAMSQGFKHRAREEPTDG